MDITLESPFWMETVSIKIRYAKSETKKRNNEYILKLICGHILDNIQYLIPYTINKWTLIYYNYYYNVIMSRYQKLPNKCKGQII